MPNHLLPYRDTHYFSGLICDYVALEPGTERFYHRYPTLSNFELQLEEKSTSFSLENRLALSNQLIKQYEGFKVSEETLKNIEALKDKNTFTVTTGHQLNLFTGPLYFLYKIISVINLSEELGRNYKTSKFVPVYWMATEDHDFDEINYFNFKGKKISWNKQGGGAVGEYSTEGLEEVLNTLKMEWGVGQHANKLIQLFSEAYLDHDNLADATRNLANALFMDYGLVIIDGNDAVLKKAFSPYAKLELFENRSYKEISFTTTALNEAGYGTQVNPREINLFYLRNGLRERIIEKEGVYYINNSALSFSKEEIADELKQYPERFSPNALLRPLYQEVILPNLCYIGGGGEIAYWFQLKDYFKSLNVPFPIVHLRNSVLLLHKKLSEKLEKMDVDLSQLFLKKHELQSEYTRRVSKIDIDFSEQRTYLKQQFEALYVLAKDTDASFLGAVAAQEKKQLNGLDHLEKRLLKAQKRNLSDQLERLTFIQEELFPNENLQERVHNFSEWYLELGPSLLSKLKKELNPLILEFAILEV